MKLSEYLDARGQSPFGRWFAKLAPVPAAKIVMALSRIERGHASNLEPVGGGVSEYKIDFGPGYRIYLARDGDMLVILLMGGTKRRQQADIDRAKAHWADYKTRRKGGVEWP